MASLSEKFPMPTLYLQTPPPPSKNSTIHVFPPGAKEMWDRWNIRVLVIFSLSLQTFLILCAPIRKRTSRKFLIFIIWTSYLLADWAASFTVGLISNNQGKSDANVDILAFWAPFLLLHLGGPDTITAFALEDNALWLRHFIGLVFQVLATAYVFIQTIPRNKLWVPAILMFLAGIIKYAERTKALYLASFGTFRASMLKDPDPGPDYAKLMDEYECKKRAQMPAEVKGVTERHKERSAFTSPKLGYLSEFEVVQYAFLYFNKFKGLIVDLIIFSFKERNESREFFLAINPIDALKVIEVELNFIYEVLFTKVVVLHNRCGLIFRLISVFSVAVALVLFNRLDKTDFKKVDVIITYALLIGALALDLISLFMGIGSDWFIASHRKDDSFVAPLFKCVLRLRKQRSPLSGLKKLVNTLMFRRWRQSVCQFNLIAYCLSERIPVDDLANRPFCYCWFLGWNKMVHFFRHVKDIVIDYLGAKELLDDWKYVSRKPVSEELWTSIFKELHEKSKAAASADVTETIRSSRGSYVLELMDLQSNVDINDLTSYIDGVDFDESLMLWHIATELCYRCEQRLNDNNETAAPTELRKLSKLLSDYMLYLLVMHQSMMSVVAGIGDIRFRDTCAEAKKFFDRRELKCNSDDMEDACNQILKVRTEVNPVTVKGDKSKSVLFTASKLAKKLQKFNDEKWMIMSKVWIEMLGYAAIHCRPSEHAQQVSRGGELMTLVWLLLAHFGLVAQPQISQGYNRVKLISRSWNYNFFPSCLRWRRVWDWLLRCFHGGVKE